MKKEKRKYASVVGDEGVNYRDIADVMTELGFDMNHSSARNHVLRIMRKFVLGLANNSGVKLSEKQIDVIAKSSAFQSNISDMLQVIEAERKRRIFT